MEFIKDTFSSVSIQDTAEYCIKHKCVSVNDNYILINIF